MRRKKELVRRLSRRRALQGAGAVMGTAALGGCDDGSSGSGGGSSSGGSTGGGSSSEGSSSGGPIGSACEDPGDLTPDELLAPVEHLVVLMMENRSFDHFFGAMSLVEGEPVDGLRGSESNRNAAGDSIDVFRSDTLVVEDDPPHHFDECERQFNGGANDGFVTEYEARGARDPSLVMGYHVREQLQTLYALADNYVLCDRWFSSFLGSTWPNRFFLHLATSDGQKVNEGVSGIPSIFDRLTDAGVSNAYYSSNLPVPLTYGRTEGILPSEDFFEHAASGNLPEFAMIDPLFTVLGTIGNDDHPPADIRMGQAFLATIYQALANSPQWDKTMLVITYDEHGGFYDHVAPPKTFDEMPDFEQLGFRVPSIIVGPHVRRGCVSSVQLDHVSVASTATRRWALEPLNQRTMMTNDLSAAIDPAFIGAPQPPAELPPVELSLPDSLHSDVPVGGQTELWDLVDRAGLPKHLDRRDAAEDIMRATLEWGERLGAIKIR